MMALASYQIRTLCMTAGKTTLSLTGSNVWQHLPLSYQHTNLDEGIQVRLAIYVI